MRSTRRSGCAAGATGRESSAARARPTPATTRLGRGARTTCCISSTGMRRAIRPKTLPRRSPCGCNRKRAGGAEYAGWPALAKLEFVDELMAELAGRTPSKRDRSFIAPMTRQQPNASASTIDAARISSDGREQRYDSWLMRVFAPRNAAAPTLSAERCLSDVKPQLTRTLLRAHGRASLSRFSGAARRAPPRAQSRSHASRLATRRRATRHAAARARAGRPATPQRGDLFPMRKYRILLMVHKTLVPPDDFSGMSESQIDDFRTEYDVLQHAAPPGPRRARRRHRRSPDRASRDDRRVAPARGLQSARRVLGHHFLRPLRRRLPRAHAAALHGLQSARHDVVARQGADETRARHAPRRDTGVQAVPVRPPLSRAEPPRPSRCS